MVKNKALAIMILGIAGLVPAAPAYAYLDAGTGSMLLQLALAGVAGGMVFIKVYWNRLKNLFGGNRDAERSTKPSED